MKFQFNNVLIKLEQGKKVFIETEFMKTEYCLDFAFIKEKIQIPLEFNLELIIEPIINKENVYGILIKEVEGLQIKILDPIQNITDLKCNIKF